jgi:hypothetical protein
VSFQYAASTLTKQERMSQYHTDRMKAKSAALSARLQCALTREKEEDDTRGSGYHNRNTRWMRLLPSLLQISHECHCNPRQRENKYPARRAQKHGSKPYVRGDETQKMVRSLFPSGSEGKTNKAPVRSPRDPRDAHAPRSSHSCRDTWLTYLVLRGSN